MKKKLQNKLSKSKVKVAYSWETYREKKQKILNRKLSSLKKVDLINNLRTKTRSNISNIWNEYGTYRYNVLTKKHFKKVDSFNYSTGFSEIYELKGNDSNFNKDFQIFTKKHNLRYIHVIFTIYVYDLDYDFDISKVFTPLSLQSFINEKQNISDIKEMLIQQTENKKKRFEILKKEFENVKDFTNIKELESFDLFNELKKQLIIDEANKNINLKYDLTGGYEVKKISVKLIYENIKKGIKTKKYREHKK